MHYPIHWTPIIGGVLAPLLWALTSYYMDERQMFIPVIVCWVVCLYLNREENRRPKNLYLSSDKSQAATHSYQLKLTGKAQGDDFWTSHRELAFADIEDFSYVKARKTTFKEILNFGPYFSVEPLCIDDKRRQVVFAEMPMGFDATMVGPFYFSTQRQYAQCLYTVPYEEYNTVIEGLEEVDLSRLVLLYNTSRCGSTLVSKAFDTMAGIQSISEPDMFTSLTLMAAEAKGDPERLKDIKRLARNTAKLIVRMRQKKHPDRPIIALKFRFQVIHIAHLLKAAIPEAKSMFLYRNGLDVIDSMGAAFIDGGIYRMIRAIGLDVLYVFHFSGLPTHLWKIIPLFDDERFPEESFRDLGAVSPFTLGWLSVMEKALTSQKNGDIDVSFRYEDIVVHKEKLLAKVLRQVGISCTVDDATRAIFKQNSQQDNVASSSRRDSSGRVSKDYAYLKPADVVNINRVIAMHPEVPSSGFMIPDTIQIKEEDLRPISPQKTDSTNSTKNSHGSAKLDQMQKNRLVQAATVRRIKSSPSLQKLRSKGSSMRIGSSKSCVSSSTTPPLMAVDTFEITNNNSLRALSASGEWRSASEELELVGNRSLDHNRSLRSRSRSRSRSRDNRLTARLMM